MRISKNFPKKYKEAPGFGMCMVHDRWERSMYFIKDGEFYTLCEWAFHDLTRS